MKQDRVGIGDRLPGFGHAYPVPLTHVVSTELPIHIHPVSLQMYTVPGKTPRTGWAEAAPHPHRCMRGSIGYGAFLAGPAIIDFVGDYDGVLRALTVVELVSALALLVVPTARPLRSEAASVSQ